MLTLRTRRPAAAMLTAALPVALLLTACGGNSGTSQALHRPSAPPSSADASAPTSETPTARPSTPFARDAAVKIRTLTDHLGLHGVSVAAVDTTSGTFFHDGATRGMRCGSIAKLAILETLLMRHQSAHPITDDEHALAVRMIEHSDNDAANSLWEDIGEGRGLRRAEPALGMRHTVPGDGIYWGFTTTSASDFVALLRNLTTTGPLNASSRRLALHLMSHVEEDQRWGVGVTADHGTTFYNKNGWLSVSTDDDRWLVNSVGIVTVQGHRVLMAVLTQHGPGFDQGIDLVEHLSRITAKALRS